VGGEAVGGVDLRGGFESDSFVGGDGDDVLDSGYGDDRLDGVGGDDKLYAGGDNDVVLGGDGADLIYGDWSPIRSGDAGWRHSDDLYGEGGGDTIYGDLGDDRIEGGEGDDRLYGGMGDDRIDGGAGSDIAEFLLPAGTSGVLEIIEIIGGDVRDFALYLRDTPSAGNTDGLTRAFEVRFNGAIATVTGSGPGVPSFSGTDVVVNVESFRFSIEGDSSSAVEVAVTPMVSGTAGDDLIVGGAGRDVIEGLGGDDRIEGGGDLDSLSGGDGDDVLLSGAGKDGLYGGAGDDILYFGSDFDFRDVIDGGSGYDQLVLQGYYGWSSSGSEFAGIERLVLLPKGDTRYGAETQYGIYSLTVGNGLVAAGATFTVDGSALTEAMGFDGSGETDGRFVLLGGAGVDRLLGGGGDDVIDGGTMYDQMVGGPGNDTYYVDHGRDTLVEAADSGFDTVFSTATDFRLGANVEKLVLVGPALWGRGNEGANILIGNSGDNLLQGLGGDDLLDGGTGDDEMRGGPGNDVIIVDSAGDLPSEAAGEGVDEVRTGLAVYSLQPAVNVENLTAVSDIAHDLRGNGGDNVVAGAGGNDLLRMQDAGSDTARGGAGNDVLYFGAAFTGGDIADGGEGRDVLILQGNYTLTLSATSLTGVESISLQSGSRTTWGDLANNFYDYNLTTNDANVAAGQQLIVNGQTLRAGEDFTFDGSAETDGYFLVYGGHGVDTLKGGSGNDAFFFEGDRWGAGDSVDGGAGRDALIISSGSGINHFDFGANALTGIESISLNNRYTTDPSQKPSYELVLSNGNVAPGATLIVNGSSLADPGQTVSIDGSAVHDGNLILFGGFGNDALTGGDGADLIQGGEGIDVLTGGGGADIFRYAGQYDATAQVPDRILDFASGVDKIDLSRIDADLVAAGDQAFHWVGSSAFTGAGAASAGELRAWQYEGSWYVEGDMDGNGSADLVIQLTTPVAAPVPSDFLL
jgi:Ca2+-binding RTX toxin-like protein